MSYTFTTRRPEGTPHDAFTAAGFAEVECGQLIDMNVAWDEGVFHFFRPQVSCRVIEVTVETESFEVRIMAHSSPEDYRLGLGLVAAVAQRLSSPIHSEDGDVLEADAFRDQFNEQWIDQMARSPLGMFNMIAAEGGTATVNGAIRPFVVGSELLRKLQFAEDRDGFPERFFAAMRQCQWMDLSEYFEASAITISLKDSGATRLLSTVGAPGLRYLVHKVDFVGVLLGNDLIFIPWNRLTEGFGSRLTHIHEEMISIAPIGADESPAMAEHLKTVAGSLC